MSTVDPQAPATKGDLKLLAAELRLEMASKGDLKELRLEMGQMYEDLSTKVGASEERVVRHFDVVAEKIAHDAFGSQKDKISAHSDQLNDHGKRIVLLEKSCGIL